MSNTTTLLRSGLAALMLGLTVHTVHAQPLTEFAPAPGTELLSSETDSLSSVTLYPIGKIKAKLNRVQQGRVTLLSYGTLGDHPPGELGIYRHVANLVKSHGGHQLNTGFNPAGPGVLETGEVIFALGAEDKAPLAILHVTNAFNYRLTLVNP